jgi:hypothetical protein
MQFIYRNGRGLSRMKWMGGTYRPARIRSSSVDKIFFVMNVAGLKKGD